jgi:hypothetical protein
MVETVPPIWRRIELSSQTTLKKFHRILQIALGWSNSHLHEFVVDGQRYGVSDPIYDEPGDVIAEGTVRLSDVLAAPIRSFSISTTSEITGGTSFFLSLSFQPSLDWNIRACLAESAVALRRTVAAPAAMRIFSKF